MTANTPPYARIVSEIRQQIESGRLRPGERVPSVRAITRRWGVAIATATKVLDTLRNLGLVRAVPGVGTIVVPRDEASPAPDERPRRRERELGLDRIVETAIVIADSEGMAAVSMRRLATEIGVATMALYRHVHSREELVMHMADAVFAAHPPVQVRERSWRVRLEGIARQQWDVYRSHAWLPAVLSITRPQLMPHGVAHTEAVMLALTDLGADARSTLHAAIGLIAYVRGMALSFSEEVEAEQDSGMNDAQWAEEHDAAFAEALAAGPYPTLSAITSQPGVDLDLESLFEFGLSRLLDGYATLAAKSRSKRR